MISRTATRTKISPARQGRSNRKTSAIDHAVRLVHGVCCLAGSASLIDDTRAELRADGIATAVRRHDTAALFDWLVAALSYQGISDKVAAEYLERHGSATWADIDAKLAGPTCPKLKSYWHFYGCRYDKISRTCSEPDHIDACPLPPINCATVGSTRWPTLFSCSSAMLPTAIWSAGSTGNSKMPMTLPAPIGSPNCGKL
jgi:hypothetical protein